MQNQNMAKMVASFFKNEEFDKKRKQKQIYQQQQRINGDAYIDNLMTLA